MGMIVVCAVFFFFCSRERTGERTSERASEIILKERPRRGGGATGSDKIICSRHCGVEPALMVTCCVVCTG